MIQRQIKNVRDLMLQILRDRTENHIALYLAESIANQFIFINKDNDAFSKAIDVETMAWVELPKYLEAGIKGGEIWIRSLSTQQKVSMGPEYDDVLTAYGELEKIRASLVKRAS